MKRLVDEADTAEAVVAGWYRNIPGLPPGLEAVLVSEVRKVMAPKVVDVDKLKSDTMAEFYRERGRKGGLARAAKLDPNRRAEIAKRGQEARIATLRARTEARLERLIKEQKSAKERAKDGAE